MMIRKSTLALATAATLGTAALMPTAANATWYGYGGYGYGKPYYSGWSYGYYPRNRFYGPRYFYGGKFKGWRYGWNRY
jgi:hypothetical protein